MTFTKALNNISNRHHQSQLFDDFLQIAVCVYSMQRSEDLYLERVKKYDKNELDNFGIALASLINEYSDRAENDWSDLLGNYFEEFGQYNAKMGQFFTPVHLCNLMAQFTTDEPKEGEHLTVNDPSCGSSRNLIAHCRKHPNNRFKYFYIGQDLDKRCCLMSVLNFVMFGMSGVIIHMNCLSLEIYGGWRIWMPETLLGVQPLSVEQCKHYVFGEKKTESEMPTVFIEPKIQSQPQLTLF